MPNRVSLTRFEQVPLCLLGWGGTIEQVTRGRFNGSLQVVRGRHLRIMRVAGTQRLLVRGREAADGLVTINPVTPGNAGGLWQGRRLAPGQLVVRGPDVGVDHLSPRQSEYLGVTLPVAALEDAARALTRREERLPVPRSWAALTPAPADFETVVRATREVLGRAPAAPPPVPDPGFDRVEQECLRVLVRSFFPDGDPPGACELTLPGRARSVRRAEELMRASLQNPLGVVELCGALGVSDRTLRLVFREHFGCGPMAYYRGLRLNAARARLVADPAGSVAAAARAFGFTHLGNFAADYRRLFGESPSETGRG